MNNWWAQLYPVDSVMQLTAIPLPLMSHALQSPLSCAQCCAAPSHSSDIDESCSPVNSILCTVLCSSQPFLWHWWAMLSSQLYPVHSVVQLPAIPLALMSHTLHLQSTLSCAQCCAAPSQSSGIQYYLPTNQPSICHPNLSTTQPFSTYWWSHHPF